MRLRVLLMAAALVGTAVPRPSPGQGGSGAAAAGGGFRVIVNPATPITTLSRDQLSRLFLRKVSRWDGGPPVAPVDLREGGSEQAAATRDAFTRAVHHRTVEMVTLYWQRQIFSGRQLPPPERASEAEVIAYVRSTPGAIGYVSDDADVRGVRVVDVTPN